jgi:uncharacterized Zn finger protein (UPF0148 family)
MVGNNKEPIIMLDMIQTAKDLINKGEELGDPELVAMGMTMLEKYNKPILTRQGEVEDYDIMDLLPEEEVELPEEEEEVPILQIKHYECTNCGAMMSYDKDGRRKCMSCKKLTLVVVEPVKTKDVARLKKDVANHRATADDFHTQIRKKVSRSRVRYNEEGEIEGTYTRTEQIQGVTNVWQDDKTEAFDDQNEKLKQLTKRSPRMRPAAKMIKVVCDECKTVHMEHPLHAGGRARYVCNKCIKRRSRV